LRRNANLDPTIKSELLDPNHSHFILVDNSQLNTFGGEIEFRARLESHIQKKIPVVMVVVEGGPNTVKTVLKSIQNEIPCIFVDVIIYLIFIFELFLSLSNFLFIHLEIWAILRHIIIRL
jgi:hypothetical protein